MSSRNRNPLIIVLLIISLLNSCSPFIRTGPDSDPDTIADCLASPEAYTWQISNFEFIEGDGVYTCKYDLNIWNELDKEQYLIIYKTYTTGSEGMSSEGWRVNSMEANSNYEIRSSYSDYYDRGGDFTWHYATKFLMINGVPWCYKYTNADTPGNMERWEDYAIQLDFPCQ